MKVLNLMVSIVVLLGITSLANAQEKQEKPTQAQAPAEAAATPETDEAEGKMVETTPEQSTPGKTKKMFRDLKLSKEQKKQIIEIKKASKATLSDAKTAIKAAKTAYQTSFDNVASDAELTEKFQALQTARQTLADGRFQQMLKIRSVLNDEQKKKFHQIKAGFRKKGDATAGQK